MTEGEKRKRGRPRGPGSPLYIRARSIRFTEAQAAGITALARKWDLSESEALRRIVAEAMRREKIL